MDIMELLQKANLPEAQGAGYYDKLTANPLFNIGIGLLSNNANNYGEFAPAFGRGVAQGMFATGQQRDRLKQIQDEEAFRRKMLESMQSGWTQNVTPGLLTQEQGYKQGTNFFKNEDDAKRFAGMAGDINEMYGMPSNLTPEKTQTYPLMPDAPLVSSELLPNIREPEPLEFHKMDQLTEQMNPTLAFDYQKQFPARPGPYRDDSQFSPNGMKQIETAASRMQGLEQASYAPAMGVHKEKGQVGDPYFDPRKAAEMLINSGDTRAMLMGWKMLSEPAQGSDATSEMKNYLFLQNLPPDRQEEFKILLSRTGSIPAAIQVFEKLKSLGTEDRALMLEGMRAIPKVDTNGAVMYLDPVTMQPRATFGKTMSPGEAASDAARQREQSYTLPAPQPQQAKPQTFSVTDPNGVVHNFPTKEAADGFKRAIRGQ